MNFLKALARMVSPMRFFVFLRLQRERRSYCYTLSKVTRLESAQDLHDKIRAIDKKMLELYFPNAGVTGQPRKDD